MNLLGATLFEPPVVRWFCPSCPQTAVTREVSPHTRYHACRSGGSLAGLTVPMLRVGTDAKVIAREREDYVGREEVQTNAHGRPIMSTIIERADGSNDCVAYAPCAVVKAEE